MKKCERGSSTFLWHAKSWNSKGLRPVILLHFVDYFVESAVLEASSFAAIAFSTGPAIP